MTLDIDWGAGTEVGLVRSVNEDSMLIAPPVFLVADGMGGHAAGDVASAIVVEELTPPGGWESVTTDWVSTSLERAHHRVITTIPGGSTVAGAAVVREGGSPYWLVFNVGDSRVYQLAEGAFVQVTVDHSVVQEMVDQGAVTAAQARSHPQRNVITRAIGSPDDSRADFWLIPVVAGQRLVLCSDGVSSELDPTDIERLIGVDAGAQDVADGLIAAALNHGGRDNITVVVVDVTALTGEELSDGPLEEQTVPRSVMRPVTDELFTTGDAVTEETQEARR